MPEQKTKNKNKNIEIIDGRYERGMPIRDQEDIENVQPKKRSSSTPSDLQPDLQQPVPSSRVIFNDEF